MQEVKQTIKNVKVNKSPGHDRFPSEFYKVDFFFVPFANLFNECLSQNQIPTT